MSNTNVYKIGGWAAFSTIAVWITLIAVDPSLGLGDPTPLSAGLLILGGVATVTTFFALFVLLRGAGRPAAAMLGLTGAGVALSVGPGLPIWAYDTGALLWGLGLAVGGILMVARDAGRALGWIGIIAGVSYLGAGGFGLAQMAGLNETFAMASFPLTFIWTAWAGVFLLSRSRAGRSEPGPEGVAVPADPVSR